MIESEGVRIIIDTSSDFRQQCIAHEIHRFDAIVYTHHHFDHIAGFDDLRAFNFTSKSSVPVYLMEETSEHLQRIFNYAFGVNKQQESSAPIVDLNLVDRESFRVPSANGDSALDCTPIPLKHGSMRVNGYRVGPVAYCTDCNDIEPEGFELLKGVDVLILDALRHRRHPTHYTLEQAVDVAETIGARKTWFTHIAHDLKHAETNARLPDGMALAHDGLRIEIGT